MSIPVFADRRNDTISRMNADAYDLVNQLFSAPAGNDLTISDAMRIGRQVQSALRSLDRVGMILAEVETR